MKFPKDVSLIIADYAAIWTIAPWVPADSDLKISTDWIEHIRLGEIKSESLCDNPMAGDILPDKYFEIECLFYNPADWAVDICEPMYSRDRLIAIAGNKNPRAIKYVLGQMDVISTKNIYTICLNPGLVDLARKLMKEHPRLYMGNDSEYAFCGVENTTIDDLPDTNENVYFGWLCENPSDWAIELIKNRIERLGDEEIYLRNCRFFANKHPWAIWKISEIIEKYHDEITNFHWNKLSGNPAAINILKAHPEMITTDIWRNPGIFEPTARPGISDILDTLTWPAS